MKKSLFTIPAGLPFLAQLAEWLLAEYGADPLALSRVRVFLPSRRACLGLREALLRASRGRALLLPVMQPLAAESELLEHAATHAQQMPGSIYTRLFLLARLVQTQRYQVTGRPMRFDHAVQLAHDLAALLDEAERAEVALSDIQHMALGDLAQHWQSTREFLAILSEHWPRIKASYGIESEASRRAAVLRALAESWRERPPATPIIVAGLTRADPAALDVLRVVLTLPQGRCILPGWDMTREEAQADDARDGDAPAGHPQAALRGLLAALDIPAASVRLLVPDVTGPLADRRALLRDLLQPGIFAPTPDTADAATGLQWLTLASIEQEAAVIALALRETLETPGKTAMLVTQDRLLARRVIALIRRAGVTLDDSAGVPLARMPAAVFLRLVAGWVAAPGLERLLTLCKHPLARGGMERRAWLEATRALEFHVLRRPRASAWRYEGPQGLALLRAELPSDKTALATLLDDMLSALRPFTSQDEAAPSMLSALLAAHLHAAEALAGETLWQGPESHALTEFLNDMQAALAENDQEVPSGIYPHLFDILLGSHVYRPRYGTHPRLRILGAVEARLQHADRVIIGGLNEGVWPPAPREDPWFSRFMRRELGLAAPEQPLEDAAHDFYTLAAAAPECILTRAEKAGGAPTTPTRWWVKLALWAASRAVPTPALAYDWPALALRWQEHQPSKLRPLAAPAPRPPLCSRPLTFSLSQIETLMRDPYRFYAERVLSLRGVPPLALVPGAADFGSYAHKALEKFTRATPGALPDDALARLLALGREALAPMLLHPPAHLLWWPRFERAAAWIVAQEAARRGGVHALGAEVEGMWRLGPFTIKGRADRVERLHDGSWVVIDYKTGSVPKSDEVTQGKKSQLSLFAAMLQEGCVPFADALGPTPRPIGGLEYWRLKGGDEGGEALTLKTPDALTDSAKHGVEALLRHYADEATAYFSARHDEARERRYDSYAHLARQKEWME